jgi:hypothetical protein
MEAGAMKHYATAAIRLTAVFLLCQFAAVSTLYGADKAAGSEFKEKESEIMTSKNNLIATPAAPQPIVMTHANDKSASVYFESLNFDAKPKFVLHMEGVRVKPWSNPYLVGESVDVKQSENYLELIARGKLDGKQDLAYVLKMTYKSEPYRVKIRGEIIELADKVEIAMIGPCFQGEPFFDKEQLPFEIAHRSFVFHENSGFGWFSDGQRSRAEYQQNGEEGPWINVYQTAKYLKLEKIFFGCFGDSRSLAVAPLVGWVSDDEKYIVAFAGKNASEVGLRWNPCLHSNPCLLADGKSFETVIYILPADRDLLMRLYLEDFPEDAGEIWFPANALWPFTRGTLLGGFEGDDIKNWSASNASLATASLSAYTSNPSRPWVFRYMSPQKPEGITEGTGSAAWEIPAGWGEAILSRTVKIESPHQGGITHIGLDVMSRSEDQQPTEINLSIAKGEKSLGENTFIMNYWTNRRLLIPLSEEVRDGELTITLKLKQRDFPQRFALDNLRMFVRDICAGRVDVG